MPGVFNWTIKRLPSLPNDLLIRSNSFDQWSAELGRELATGLLPVIEGKEALPAMIRRRRASLPNWRG